MTVDPSEIVLDHVSMRYGRGPEILSDVNLRLGSGSFSFLTGPSGAGKSSLLKLIYLALRPTRGLVSVFGQSVDKLPSADIQNLKRRIGVVSQDYELIPHLSVFENVALPLRATGHGLDAYERDARELIDWVGLGHQIAHKPITLSGGEQQRVAIARAVITRPEILIADEPTANVDHDMGQRLIRLFLELNRNGTTVMVATHDQSLLSTIQADSYHLEGGKLVQRSQA